MSAKLLIGKESGEKAIYAVSKTKKGISVAQIGDSLPLVRPDTVKLDITMPEKNGNEDEVQFPSVHISGDGLIVNLSEVRFFALNEEPFSGQGDEYLLMVGPSYYSDMLAMLVIQKEDKKTCWILADYGIEKLMEGNDVGIDYTPTYLYERIDEDGNPVKIFRYNIMFKQEEEFFELFNAVLYREVPPTAINFR
jgi:hypothetical protein